MPERAVSNQPSSVRYALSLRWMHWVIFFLVLTAYVCINVSGLLPKGSSAKGNVMAAHFTAGLLVLLLIVPRLALRLRHGQPPITPPLPTLTHWFSKFTHVLLYLFLFVQPILGFTTIQLGGHGVSWFGVTIIPGFAQPDKSLSHQIGDIHATIGTIFYYVIGLHILGALYDYFWRKDNTLQRMV